VIVRALFIRLARSTTRSLTTGMLEPVSSLPIRVRVRIGVRVRVSIGVRVRVTVKGTVSVRVSVRDRVRVRCFDRLSALTTVPATCQRFFASWCSLR